MRPMLAGRLAFSLLGCGGAAQAANLILNGGFEDGTYSNTQNGSTNPNVPVDQTPNAAFDDNSGFNQVVPNPHSGMQALQIGDYDDNPEDMISQSAKDVVGASDDVQFFYYYGRGGDPVANFFCGSRWRQRVQHG